MANTISPSTSVLSTDLDKVIHRLETERLLLLRSNVVLQQKRNNIVKYLELLHTSATQLGSNTTKKRAKIIVFHLKEHSLELFVLCALATNQQMLGTVRWTQDELDVVMQWWDLAEQPLAGLHRIWTAFTQGNKPSIVHVLPTDTPSRFPSLLRGNRCRTEGNCSTDTGRTSPASRTQRHGFGYHSETRGRCHIANSYIYSEQNLSTTFNETKRGGHQGSQLRVTMEMVESSANQHLRGQHDMVNKASRRLF